MAERGINIIGGVAEFFRVVGIHAHVDIDAVNLAEFFERVAVFVHELVVARQGGENVLFQIDARGDDGAGRRR